MPRPPRLADVAAACGVSIATASKALSPHLDRCDLHPDTRARIVAQARDMGWSRDRPRSARARRKWHNIGVLWGYRNLSMSSYEGVPEVLARTVDGAYRLILTPVPEAKDWKELQLSLRLDGVVVLGVVDDAILAELERDEYPAVLVNVETRRSLHQMLGDDLGGVTALMRHLAGLGHRRIVFVRNPWPAVHYSERDRLRAVRNVAAETGMQVDDVRGLQHERIVAHCRDGATAVVCYSHIGLDGIMDALRHAGLRIPRDVSLACCHDVASFARYAPSITAVNVPIRDMAALAGGLLMQLIAGTADPGLQRRVLAETVAFRGSCAVPRENRFAKARRRP